MKKICLILLSALLTLSLCACGSDAPAATPSPTPMVTTQPTNTPEPTPVPEWKDLTAEYEAWVDDYIQTFREAKANPTNNDLYDKLEDMYNEASKWDSRLYKQEMSMVDAPDLDEYVDEVLRITQKLNDFANSQTA